MSSVVLISSNGYSVLEHDAMIEGGLSDNQWYNLTRWERAKRVAWLIISRVTKAVHAWEEREANNKGN